MSRTRMAALSGLAVALGGVAMAAEVEGYAELEGRWAAVELDGTPFSARAVLEIADVGGWRGEGPCNRFGFTQSEAYPAFRAGGIRATKRACPDLPAENAFFAALQQAQLAIHADGVLVLSDEDGMRLVFQRVAE